MGGARLGTLHLDEQEAPPRRGHLQLRTLSSDYSVLLLGSRFIVI